MGGSPARGQASPSRPWGRHSAGGTQSANPGNRSDYSDLISLVSAQQSRLQSQHAEIKHVSILLRTLRVLPYPNLSLQCDNELKYLSDPPTGHPEPDYLHSGQLEAVLSEVRRLEEAAQNNDQEMQTMEERR